MKSFNFVRDREDIGPFVSASLPIVCPSGDFLRHRHHHRERHKNLWHDKKIQEGHTMVQFRVEFASESWPSQAAIVRASSVVWSSAPSAKFCYTKAIRWRRDADIV